MFYSEKRAKEFLKENKFEILDSVYVRKISEIKKISDKLNFPVVVKIFGDKIVHKKNIGGVKLNVKNYEEILGIFQKFGKIKNFEGIVIQEQVKGTEILLGLKRTPEFHQVIVFGRGGSDVEKAKDVSFRIIPLDKKDALEMMKETKIFSKLKRKEIKSILKNIFLLNKLSQKHPRISELDINPLMIQDKFAKIIDARILFS
ncbi:acetate--CoA ligase family protein [Candidatus Pacearchaeota archaeon]|nr:acetate--CoA ligase family protein [Candidatus Pacearchaeota archaeon]